MINKTVCFTGHRPQVAGKYKEWIESKLRQAIKAVIIENGIDYFISGGALGVDQWAAQSVIDLKSEFPHIRLTIARPFPSQDHVWEEGQQAYYRNLCKAANSVVDVNQGEYAAWKYHARDKWMVDNSIIVIAVWNGQKNGGTAATVRLAKSAKKKIFLIDPVAKSAEWL